MMAHDDIAEGDWGELEPLAAMGCILWYGTMVGKAGIVQRGALSGAVRLGTV